MKKTLTLMLVIILAAVLFAGCGGDPTPSSTTPTTDPGKATPTPSAKPAFIDLRPTYSSNKDAEGVWDDVITFNVFNTGDYQTRWTDYSNEWMLENFHLKVGYQIPAITGFDSTWTVCQSRLLENPANREAYNSKVVSLFLTDSTAPDFFPALYGSCMGTDGVWFEIQDKLVDLAPYVEKGGSLHDGYVGWVWKDQADYWELAKQALMTDEGKLYVIPRREMMPIQKFLSYSTINLPALGISWEDIPETWADFLELLRKYMNSTLDGDSASSKKAAFLTTDDNGGDIIQFVATTYGLDFTEDFSWTSKNGEPLWTYYWDEYLEILKDVNLMAAEGIVLNNPEKPGIMLNYTLDRNDETYKSVCDTDNGVWSGIAAYTREDKKTQWTTSGHNRNKWALSDKWVSQDGYDYSLAGGSAFDCNYLAIGNKLGDEFTARIIDFWNASLCEDGQNTYVFGKYGIPFADTVEEAGGWIYDEDGKIVYTNHANVFPFTKTEGNYWWDKRDADWWIEVDEHYAQYIINFNAIEYNKVGYGDGDTLANYLGFDDIKVFENVGGSVGTYFFGDVTAYPQGATAYTAEGMAEIEYKTGSVKAGASAKNSECYSAFYSTTKEILGKDANAMDKKISDLKTIAKDFTIGFLSGEKTQSDWTNYIKSLQDAGYDDVYEFYCDALIYTPTTKKDGVKTQADVNAERAN